MISGKRPLLAHSLFWSGATFLLSKLPKHDLLLVLNYHRIGDPDGHSFCPAIRVNLPVGTRRYDVKRNPVEDLSLTRFRVEAAMCLATGRFWP